MPELIKSPTQQPIKQELRVVPLIIINKEIKPWKDHKDKLRIVARWLFENKRLQEKDLPVKDQANRTVFLLNSKPQNGEGREFHQSTKITDSVYLNTCYDAVYCDKNAKYLMKIFAPDIEFEILGEKHDTYKTENEKEHNGRITTYEEIEKRPLIIDDDPEKRKELDKNRLKNMEQERKARIEG